MFENNDEFGVEEFKNEFEYIFNKFAVKVKYISKQEDKQDEYLQGDFLGIRNKSFKDEESFIWVHVNSENEGKREEQREGKTSRGVEEYSAIVRVRDSVKTGDLIQFVNSPQLPDKDEDAKYRIEVDSNANHKLIPAFQKIRLIRL